MTSKEIGARISLVREEEKLTRKELAQKIHVAASTITRYEKGEINKIKLPIINAIANALGINPLWIIGQSVHKSVSAMKAQDEVPFHLSRHEKELVKKYRQLPQGGKDTVDAVLNVQYDLVKPKLSDDTGTS